jgi:hypothetical protein
MTRDRLAAIAVVGTLCVLPACGSDDEESSSKPAAVAIEITGGKGKFSVKAPKKLDAGLVKINFTNATKAPQDAQLVRIDGDHTAADVTSKVLDTKEGAPTPDWAHGAGGVGTLGPGGSGSATQVLEPGTYYVASTGPQTDDEKATPYSKQGAIVKFEVTGDKGGTVPQASSKIVAREYSFTATNLKAGHNQVEFENAGKELHHVIAFPYIGDATEADVKKAFKSNQPPKGKPPVDFDSLVGSTVLDGGEKQVIDLNLKKGRYELVCFISDRKGGPPHVAKGMLREVSVK